MRRKSKSRSTADPVFTIKEMELAIWKDGKENAQKNLLKIKQKLDTNEELKVLLNVI